MGVSARSQRFLVSVPASATAMAAVVPTKCSRRVALIECSRT